MRRVERVFCHTHMFSRPCVICDTAVYWYATPLLSVEVVSGRGTWLALPPVDGRCALLNGTRVADAADDGRETDDVEP